MPNRALGLMFTSACSNIFVRLKISGVMRSRKFFLSTSWSACFRSMSEEESLRTFRPTISSRRSEARLSPLRPTARKIKTTAAITRPPIKNGIRVGKAMRVHLPRVPCRVQFGRGIGLRTLGSCISRPWEL